MNKRYLEKLEKLVEKLKTASDKQAYKIIEELECGEFLGDIRHSIVKNDFSIDPFTANSVMLNLIEYHHSCLLHGGGYLWNFNDNKIELGFHFDFKCRLTLLVSTYKNVEDKCYSMGYHNRTLAEFAEPVILSEEFAVSLANLEGFRVKEPGLWVRKFGKIKNLAQFKKEVLPVWNRTFELLKNFAEELK